MKLLSLNASDGRNGCAALAGRCSGAMTPLRPAELVRPVCAKSCRSGEEVLESKQAIGGPLFGAHASTLLTVLLRNGNKPL
jgi:hypothetical protein